MALIKCKKCGQPVSDKADFCSLCGAPVEVAVENNGFGNVPMVTCGECGFEFRAALSSCPECGSTLAITDVEITVDAEQKEETTSVAKQVAFYPDRTVVVEQKTKEITSNQPKTEERRKEGNAKYITLFLAFVFILCCVLYFAFISTPFSTTVNTEEGNLKKEECSLNSKKDNPVVIVEEVVDRDSLAIVAILNEVNHKLNDIYYSCDLPLSDEYAQLLARSKSITDSITQTTGEEWNDAWYVCNIDWLNQMDPDSVEYKIIYYDRAEYDSLNTDVLKKVIASIEFNDPCYLGYLSTARVVFISVDGKWVIDNVGVHKEQLRDFIEENTNCRINGYEYVDLGLPSGTLWASCNVGATSPEEYGNYYSWGETTTKANYTEDSYQYYNGGYVNIGGDISGTQYDVAHVEWGGSWRIPTEAEFRELNDRCTWSWTSYNGVNGYQITGPNGNSIFLPAAGTRCGSMLENCGSYGIYWSGTYYADGYNAYYLYTYDVSHYVAPSDGCEYGNTVRPVRDR